MSESVVEDVKPSKKIIHVTVERGEFDKVFQISLNETRKSLKLPGFRAGRVPKRLIIEKMSDELQKKSMERIVENSFREAALKWNITPVSTPIFSNFKNEKDSPLTFDLTVDVKPEISVKGYKKLKLEKLPEEIGKEEIEHALAHLRANYAKTVEVDRACENGDTVTIDFTGYDENDKKISGASGKYLYIELGSGRMVPGFEENLVGLKAGEKKSFSIKFPENYNKKLAGKTARFDVEIKKVLKKELPDLNDEFAKNVNPKYENMQKLKNDIKEELKKEKEEQNKIAYKEKIFEQLIEKNPFDVPESLLVAESNNMINSYVRNLVYQGADIEGKDEFKYENLRKKFDPIAEKRVKSTLIVMDIAEKENIAIEDKEIAEEIAKEATYYGKDPKTAYKEMEKTGRISEIRMLKLEEKVSDFILKNAEITDIDNMNKVEENSKNKEKD